MSSAKLTVVQAAIEAIKGIGRPASANEIFDYITTHNLYVFNAKDPQSILKSALRRHSNDMASSNRQAALLLRQVENNKYQLR